jgi:hypothetical protein
MYGKNTLDKIYLTQKKLLPTSLYLPKGKLFILSRTNCYSL